MAAVAEGAAVVAWSRGSIDGLEALTEGLTSLWTCNTVTPSENPLSRWSLGLGLAGALNKGSKGVGCVAEVVHGVAVI